MVIYPLFGALAQLVAHNTGSVGVRSSNLLCSTKIRTTHAVVLIFCVSQELLTPSLTASVAVVGEKICRPPVAEISTDLFSTEREQSPRCGAATIEVADRSSCMRTGVRFN